MLYFLTYGIESFLLFSWNKGFVSLKLSPENFKNLGQRFCYISWLMGLSHFCFLVEIKVLLYFLTLYISDSFLWLRGQISVLAPSRGSVLVLDRMFSIFYPMTSNNGTIKCRYINEILDKIYRFIIFRIEWHKTR